MSVGERLREERRRLGLSQERLAGVAGVAKNTAINWEKDQSSPTAAALNLLAEAGADAVYILTGQRSAQSADAPIAHGPEPYATDAPLDAGARIDAFKHEFDVRSDAEFAAIIGYHEGTVARWRITGKIPGDAIAAIMSHLEYRRRNEKDRDEFSGFTASKRQFSKALVIYYIVKSTLEEDGDLEADNLLFTAIYMDSFEVAASRLLDQELGSGAKNLLVAFRRLLNPDLVLRLAKELTAMANEDSRGPSSL